MGERPRYSAAKRGIVENNLKRITPSFQTWQPSVIPGPDRESDTGSPLALLLHDGFQLARVGGKGLDVELLLIRDARSRNVVKQTPSSLPGTPLPAGSSETEIRIPQECQRGAKKTG
jgi:hypothetical protein